MRTGFTLVEMVVVIGVIGVLASLLLPALSKVKTRAQSLACVNNLRQIGLESTGRGGGSAVFYDLETAGLSGLLLSWAGFRSVLKGGVEICPATSARAVPTISNGFKRGSVSSPWWGEYYEIKPGGRELRDRVASSYGLNDWVIPSTFRGAYEPGHKGFFSEDDIYFPSNTPLIGDAVRASACPTADDLPARNLNEPNGQYMETFTIPRHGARPRVGPTDHPPEEKLPGAINMAFYDGHAEQVKLDRLWSLYWHKDYVAPPKRPGLK